MTLRRILIALAAFLMCLPLAAQYRDDQFKRDAFTQTYADTTEKTAADTSQLFSFKEFFGGLAHKRTASLKTLTMGSVVFIGANQIYHKQYWKLPIIYGGYLGLISGYRWNQKYYRTYANAYRHSMLRRPNASYRDFLPPNYDVESHRSYLEKAFKRKRNTYRNYRDYCLVGMIGVYLVSIVDAYVDASLYHFDVSTDLDANNRPTLMVGYRLDF